MDDELIELERRGWEALCGPRGAEFYEGLMTDEALMVFASGTLDRSTAIDAIREAEPWDTFSIESAQVIHPAPDLAVVAYHATARRGGSEYRAWMSSTYVRDADRGWRLVLHQQSPSG